MTGARVESDVLIVGAGPTGLVLALWLARLGLKPRLIDRLPAPLTTSRALAVQVRTLELYRQADLTDAVLAHAHAPAGANFWVRGTRQARLAFAGRNDFSRYGPVIFPQDQHERLLHDRLANYGVEVERDTALVDLENAGDHVGVTLRGADGQERASRARYVVGCDGAGSAVRHALGLDFPGATYPQVFYVADIDADGPALDGELHIDLDDADFLAIFPLRGAGRARLVGTVRGERAAHAEDLRFEDVSARAIRNMQIDVRRVNWFSTYRVHHRVADRFRAGRVFLAGDAAHIHSPAGGQGMNTGIGDAINLAWKLKAVVTGAAPERLLDTYDAERRPFAQRLVATTDRGFRLATAEGRVANFFRTRIVPRVLPALLQNERLSRYAFRAISQTGIDYRASAISEGRAGRVAGGDRLPWVQTDGDDNYAALHGRDWRLHVYGESNPALAAWCRRCGMQLDAYAWRDAYRAAGLARDAMYLVRPDAYVALAAARQDAAALDAYFARHGFHREFGMAPE